MKDYEINELNIQVNDLRGKFIKPTLKKVSKYENKFAKLQKKAAEFNFRNQLKTVKKKEFELEDDKANAPPKPEWAAGPKKEGEEDGGEGEGEQVEGEANVPPPEGEPTPPQEPAPQGDQPSVEPPAGLPEEGVDPPTEQVAEAPSDDQVPQAEPATVEAS